MLQELATDLDKYLALSYEVVDKEGSEISPGEDFTVRFTVRYIADPDAPARPIFARVALFLQGTAWAQPVDGPWIESTFPNPDDPMQELGEARHLEIAMKAKGTMPFNLPEAIGQVRLHARCVAIELRSRPRTALIQIVPRATTRDRDVCEESAAAAATSPCPSGEKD